MVICEKLLLRTGEHLSIKVSYVVPLYNSEKTFEQCLNAIISQKGRFVKEIILIDNSKRKQHIVMKKRKKQGYYIKHYHFKRYFYAGQARNIGLQMATGDFIACIDSDVVISLKWTQNMLDKHKKLNKGNAPIVISGSLDYYPGVTGITSKCLFFWEFYKMTSAVCSGFVHQIQSNNLFFEYRLARDRLVFFPEVKYAEDVIWARTFLKKGCIYLYAQNKTKHITLHCFYKHPLRLGIGAAKYRLSYIRNRYILFCLAPIMTVLRFFNVIRYMRKQRFLGIQYVPIMFFFALLYLIGFFYACCVDDSYHYS